MAYYKELFLLSFTIICSVQMIQSDYIAAVVEYKPINATFPNKTVEANLNQYVYFIEMAQLESVQIIVFPEYGLTGCATNLSECAIEIPQPTDNIHFEHYWLQILSNAAVAHSMYVVVNLLEKEKVEINTLYYNTDIVFDTNGRIVAKHRKINLFLEPLLTPGDSKQNQNIFTTDFGVTFGVFTCADISFYNPAKTILSNPAVTDIIFPTAWSSFLPFFHSLSIQYGYALAYKVNLLAANLNSVQNGISGSGIYGADGTIYSYYLSDISGSKMQIATVKTTPTSEPSAFNKYGLFENSDDTVPILDHLHTKRYFDSEKYVFKRLHLSQLNIKEEVCHRSFCCTFNINVSSTALNSSEIYQIMAYRGPAILGELRNLKLCSLVACKSSDLNTCGDRNIKLTSKLESVLVETNVLDEREGFYLPFSLTGDLVPVFNAVYNSTAYKGARIYKHLASNIKQGNILAFGIAANNAIILSFNSMLIVGILVFNFMR